MMSEKEKEEFRKGIAEGKYMFHEWCSKHGAYDRPMYDKDGFHQFHTIPICPKCEEEKMRIPGTTFTDEGNPVRAKDFCTMLHANVDNEKLSDKAFRELVRNTLPIVEYPRPEEKNEHQG